MTTHTQPADSVFARSQLRTVFRRIAAGPATPTTLFLVLLIIGISVVNPAFIRVDNLQAILAQSSIVALIALGVNQVIIAGEIDISVGSLLGLCTVAAGTVAATTDGFILPFVTAVVIGLAAGTVNGFLVTRLRIPSIVATLGMLYALSGILLITASGAQIVGFPKSTGFLGNGTVGGVSVSILVLVLAFIVLTAVSRFTTWGRDVFAVGDNEAAAKLAGVRVERVRFGTFVLVGGLTGVAGMIYLGQFNAVQPNVGTGLELQVVAAVVIGGTSIVGGRGSTLAPVIGAVLVTVVFNALILLGVPNEWTDVVSGALILIALLFDTVRRRITEKP